MLQQVASVAREQAEIGGIIQVRICSAEYRVTHHVVLNLLLTTKQKLRCSISKHILKRNFCFHVIMRLVTRSPCISPKESLP